MRWLLRTPTTSKRAFGKHYEKMRSMSSTKVDGVSHTSQGRPMRIPMERPMGRPMRIPMGHPMRRPMGIRMGRPMGTQSTFAEDLLLIFSSCCPNIVLDVFGVLSSHRNRNPNLLHSRTYFKARPGPHFQGQRPRAMSAEKDFTLELQLGAGRWGPEDELQPGLSRKVV